MKKKTENKQTKNQKKINPQPSHKRTKLSRRVSEVVCVELKIDASQLIQAESFRRPETLTSCVKEGQTEQKHRFICITDR